MTLSLSLSLSLIMSNDLDLVVCASNGAKKLWEEKEKQVKKMGDCGKMRYLD